MNLILTLVLFQIKKVAKFNSLGLILNDIDNVYTYKYTLFMCNLFLIF